MNVIVYGCKYKVWDTDDLDKRRFLVTKDRRCSCGLVKCEHIRAVGEYLQRGGRKAPEEVRDPRPTIEERVARIRMLRELAIRKGTLSEATMALIAVQRANTETERLEWIKKYSLPQMWPVEMRK